ncbi:hypothetical protein AOLI_G00211620 [Acnodon oligacanthus]
MIALLLTLCALLHAGWGECEAGWRPYQDRCYFFSSSTKTWHDALDDCQSKHSHLMSIRNIHERLWVSTQIGSTIYWIGLNDIVSEGNWEWSDGSVYYPYLAYWREGQPDNHNDNEDCGQVDGNSNGRWNDEHCTAQRPYICKRDNPNPTVLCDTANGWEQYGSNCYKLNSHLRKSWIGARTDCVKDGADLVSVESAGEEQYVTSRLDPSRFDLWIGYSTLVRVSLFSRTAKCTTLSCQVQPNSTTFTWSDASTSSYTNWPSGQPDLTDKQSGVCTAMIKDAGEDYGKWRTHVEEFLGSVDRGTPETQLLGTPVSVKHIRILPLDWHNEAGLRFEILGCTPDYAITCSKTPSLDHSVDKMTVHCPAGCASESYNVYGTLTYRGDSNICAAAIHAGVVLNELGGDCTVLKAPGQNFYSGSSRNGITSKQYDTTSIFTFSLFISDFLGLRLRIT